MTIVSADWMLCHWAAQAIEWRTLFGSLALTSKAVTVAQFPPITFKPVFVHDDPLALRSSIRLERL